MGKKDVYEIVTEKIVESLENGVIPWECPWPRQQAWPTNASTGRPYSGVNVLLLAMSTMIGGFSRNLWCTYKQAQKMGGNVRKGEESSLVTFFKLRKIDDKDSEGGTRTVPILRYYRVFNVDQCDGLELDAPQEDAQLCESERVTAADAFFAQVGAEFTEGGQRACFIPKLDVIQVPKFELFNDPSAYYATLAHEHVHWTGSPTRLDRDLNGRFGSESYAAEELIAELGGAFVCARLGFDYRGQAASYLQSWLDVLNADKYAIFTASRKAGEAADYLCQLGGLQEEVAEKSSQAA